MTTIRIAAAILWLSLAVMAQTPQPPAKVKCAGITKTGQQCKRTVKPPAVYCYQHKAQAVAPCTTDMDCEQKAARAKKSK
jgi:hypothetical protein